jgi:hypothetical protein
MKTRRPVPFVVGMGRSGTTLLRLMLDAHPELAIPPETHFLADLQKDLTLVDFYNILVTYRTWSDFGISHREFLQELRDIENFDVSNGLRCFYRLYARRFAKVRWGDKTPLYSSRMLNISDLLPETRFVHLIRDGRDSALSYRSVWFGPRDDLEAHARMGATRLPRN